MRGFTIRLPLDLFVVASANPEDYTSRGRIITPLKDRLGSQIRTHYPRSLEHEIAIVRQEKQRFPRGRRDPARRRARRSWRSSSPSSPTSPGGRPRSASGAASRSACRSPTWRSSRRRRSSARSGSASRWRRRGSRDLGAVLAVDDRQGRGRDRRRGHARGADRRAARDEGGVRDVQPPRVARPAVDPVIEAFEDGLVLETGERVPSREYVRWMREVPGLARRGRAARHVRRDRRRPGARARRVRRRVPARGPPPAAPPQQGPRRDGRDVPALTPRSRVPSRWPS